MRRDHETILAALLDHLAASVVINFTGTTTKDSPIISRVSSFEGLFAGLPTFGPGISRGTLVDACNEDAGELTLNQSATQDGVVASFTTGFLTKSRRLKKWDTVTSQPAIFLRHTNDFDVYDGGGLCKTLVIVELWIYSKAGSNPDTAPDTALNNLVKLIRRSMRPDDEATEEFTLNKLVKWCRIEGESLFDPGDTDSQSKATLPIRILIP